MTKHEWKIKVLQNVLEHIKSEDYVRFYYFSRKDNRDCCCVVGYIMKECGIRAEDILEHNDRRITYLINTYPKVLKPVLNVFEVSELLELQRWNDRGTEYKDKFIRDLGFCIKAMEQKPDLLLNEAYDIFLLARLVMEEYNNGKSISN